MLTDSSLQVRRIPSHLDVSGIHRCLFFSCADLRLAQTLHIVKNDVENFRNMYIPVYKAGGTSSNSKTKAIAQSCDQHLQGGHRRAPMFAVFLRLPADSFPFLHPAHCKKPFWYILIGCWRTHIVLQNLGKVFFSSGAFFMVLKNACALCSLQAYAMCNETLKSGEGLWV